MLLFRLKRYIKNTLFIKTINLIVLELDVSHVKYSNIPDPDMLYAKTKNQFSPNNFHKIAFINNIIIHTFLLDANNSTTNIFPTDILSKKYEGDFRWVEFNKDNIHIKLKEHRYKLYVMNGKLCCDKYIDNGTPLFYITNMPIKSVEVTFKYFHRYPIIYKLLKNLRNTIVYDDDYFAYSTYSHDDDLI